MVMKLTCTETEEQIIIERLLYTRRYSLILDKSRCVKCEICRIVCPREAIEIKSDKIEGEKQKSLAVKIDREKCSFCGICVAICPFGAFTLTINGERIIPVLEKESFPNLIRQVEVDESKCPRDCDECQEACPFSLIQVSADETTGAVKVNIDVDHCPGCRLCELRCPEGAISVKKIFSGVIRINQEKCPEGCRECVDACPIPYVLRISEDGKVEVNDYCCIYCGACRIVCPEEGALELERTVVAHVPVRSGAWNSALEKLTSTKDLAKELAIKRMIRAIESTRRRVG